MNHLSNGTIRSRMLTVILCFALLISVISADAFALSEEVKTVRVGFFAFDGYHRIDADGNKSGYGYDFLVMMKRFANVTYEYVGYDCSWDQMQQMLLNGEIDMVTSAHKTQERREVFDYSMPIGTNYIRITARADEDRIVAGDFDTYNNMRLGLLEGNSINTKVAEYANDNGFTYIPVYYSTDETLRNALFEGKIDAIAASSLRRTFQEKVLSEFGAEPFYAIVKKGNEELLDTIDNAIRQMDVTEGDWRNKLHYSNYDEPNSGGIVFTDEELQYIANHAPGGKKIRIAVDNNWAPFESGSGDTYIGIIPDIWERIMQISGMDYEFYDSGKPIFDVTSLKDSGADVYLGYAYDENIMESNGLIGTAPFMKVSASLVSRRGLRETGTIGISKTNPRLNSRYPATEDRKIVEYEDTPTLLAAVENGSIDAGFLYTFEIEQYMNEDTKGILVESTVPEVSLPLCAVCPDDMNHTLIGILEKCLGMLTDTEINAIVSRNLAGSITKLTLIDYVRMYPAAFGAAIVLVLVLLGVIVNRVIIRKIAELHNKELERKVEEIGSLNAELRVRQRNLEESAAEQKVQLEEIASLNANLEDTNMHLERQLSITGGLAGVYFAVYYGDLKTGHFFTVKQPDFVRTILEGCTDINQAFEAYLKVGVAHEDLEAMQEFTDYRTLLNRLDDRDYIVWEYHSAIETWEWCRSSWIVAERDSNGKATHVVYAVEDITELINERRKMRIQLEIAGLTDSTSAPE